MCVFFSLFCCSPILSIHFRNDSKKEARPNHSNSFVGFGNETQKMKTKCKTVVQNQTNKQAKKSNQNFISSYFLVRCKDIRSFYFKFYSSSLFWFVCIEFYKPNIEYIIYFMFVSFRVFRLKNRINVNMNGFYRIFEEKK